MNTERADDRMRVSVDHDLCSGTGYCRDALPALFAVEDKRVWLRGDFDLADTDVEQVEEAAATCPWFAITVEETG